MENPMGGWPGPSITVPARRAAEASARATSSITASKTAPGGRAIRSRIWAVPVSVSAVAADMPVAMAKITRTPRQACRRGARFRLGGVEGASALRAVAVRVAVRRGAIIVLLLRSSVEVVSAEVLPLGPLGGTA